MIPLSTKMALNTLITAFDEFQYFTSATNMAMNVNTFNGCTNLKKLNLLNIKTISGSTAGRATNGGPISYTGLSEIYLPNLVSLPNISYSFFNNRGTAERGSISRITIGEKLTLLQNNNNLAYLYSTPVKILAPTPPTGAVTLTITQRGTAYLYVPDDSVEAYKAAAPFANWASYIKPMSECPW